MNLFIILVVTVLFQVSDKWNTSEYHRLFNHKTSLSWRFMQSAMVLSGEIEQTDSNSITLRNLDIHRGAPSALETYEVNWEYWDLAHFELNDRIMIFVDSTGFALPTYGFYHSGCVEMKALYMKQHLRGYGRLPYCMPVPSLFPSEWIKLLSKRKLIENTFIPLSVTLNFPLSGESLEFSIVQSNDSIYTVSEYDVLDSCQVTKCFGFFAPPEHGKISFYARVKKNRNFTRTHLSFWGGYDFAYENNTLSVSFDSRHCRSLEEFLDHAATGNMNEYNILIDTDYDFSYLGLNGPLRFHKAFYSGFGLWSSDSISLQLCINTPEILDYTNGFICYELISADTLVPENLLCFKYTDSLAISAFDFVAFWQFVSENDNIGEIYLYNSVDSSLVFLDSFSCDVEEYDSSISNKDSTALFRDSAYTDMYGSRKPTYFRTELGDTLNIEICHSEGMMADTAFTYTWLLTNDGEIIHPIEIIEGYVENANYVRSKFTYIFTIPDSIRGKLLIDMRGRDRGGTPLWWGYGRSYWGIVDVIDSTDCHREKR